MNIKNILLKHKYKIKQLELILKLKNTYMIYDFNEFKNHENNITEFLNNYNNEDFKINIILPYLSDFGNSQNLFFYFHKTCVELFLYDYKSYNVFKSYNLKYKYDDVGDYNNYDLFFNEKQFNKKQVDVLLTIFINIGLKML